jgi:glycosyltransferase involved in cell wall biosynthesis
MRVAFDHSIFCLQRYGGISRYFCALGQALTDQGVRVKVFAPLHRNEYLLEERGLEQVSPALPGYPPRTARMFVAASGWLARRGIRRWKPEIVHRTYYDAASLGLRGVPNVVTVYDMIHERFPELFGAGRGDTEQKRRAVEKADHVFAISEHTSRDLQEMWGIDPGRITVTHLAAHAPEEPREPAPAGDRGVPSAPFLLFVGRRDGYKNFGGLLAAVARAPRLRDEFQIVAFGDAPFSPGQLAAAEAAGLRPGRLLHVSGGDDLLAAYYRSAAALIYPSLYEGFGLPPLEAMSHGCPVCVSKTSSIPEVVGDSGEYFDPSDPADIVAAISRVVFDPSRQRALAEAGRKRAATFTWAACAERTARVYRSLIEG